MKKTLSLLAIGMLLCISMMAQAPQALNYQGIARTASGAAISGTNISIRLSILSGSATGTVVYQETQTATTNSYGLYNIGIGNGTPVSGSFSTINWGAANMWMLVEMDPSGGSAYTTLGTNQLLSVPYSMYANSAGSAAVANYATSANSANYAGTVPMSGDVTGTNNVSVVDRIQGRVVSTAVPTSGQALIWDAVTSQWTPGTVTGTGSGVTSITASAPLTGGVITTTGTIGLGTVGTASTYGSATQVPVITTDAFGRVTSVVNTTITGPTSLTMGGDVTGTTAANTISSLQGNPVSAAAPTLGNVLGWSGTQWVPTAGVSSTMGGDVTGTTGANTITAIQGNPVLAPTPAVGDVLQWDGTDWVNTPSSVPTFSGTVNYVPVFTGATTIGNSIVYEDPITNRIGVNTTAPIATIDAGPSLDSVVGFFANVGTYQSLYGVVDGELQNSNPGTGVRGFAQFNTANNNTDGVDGYGTYTGLYGNGYSSYASGVFTAQVTGVSGTSYGSDGYSVGSAGFAYNYPLGIPTNSWGIYGYATGGIINYAGYFQGDVNVTGTMFATAKAFKIDHPLDPDNKYLIHSCVESNDMKNIYDGNVTTDASSKAIVTLPDYFEALNKDYRYQLTTIGSFAQVMVSKEISGNTFEITTSVPNVKVSWQVTGIRQDAYSNAHRLPNEIEKESFNKGKYINAKDLNKPIEKQIGYEMMNSKHKTPAKSANKK